MVEREQCSLRPITEDDLDQLLRWRNSRRIRANMYSDHVITVEEHQGWFERSRNAEASLHLLFELRCRPAGLVYFTDLNSTDNRANWGFYLGEEELPKGAGLALGTLGLEHAFTELRIRKLCGETFAFNEASVRFHKKLGFREEGRFVQHVWKGGRYEDVIRFALFQDEWRPLGERLTSLAFGAGKGGG